MDRLKSYLRRIPKKYLVISGVVAGVLLLLVIVGSVVVLNKREPLLARAIERAKAKMSEEYQVDLMVQKAYFSGLTEVTLEQVSVVPQEREQLAAVDYLTVSVKIFPLLTGKVKIADLELKNASLSFIKKDSLSNYDFFFRSKDSTETNDTNEPLNLAKVADRMFHQVLYKIPDNMELRNFDISYKDDSLSQRLTVPHADIDNGDLQSTIVVNDGQFTWHLDGELHPGRNDLFFQLTAENGKVEFPFLEKKYGLKLNFDTLEAHLKRVRWKGEEFHIEASGRIANLLLNHWRIASNDVVVPNGSMDAGIVIGPSSVALSETSEVQLEKLILRPTAKMSLLPHKTFALGLTVPETPAQDAFDSFPKGLFESLDGIRASGTIKYSFDLFLDTKEPDSVVLNSALEEKGFKIDAFGKTNFAKINTDFVYVPVEDGKPGREIVVGPANPDFTPLNNISPHLRNAVLTAEDPSFFHHEGFVKESIRASIATNFKEKAFKRGGSTISMQLVKNVYLDREKTLARKVEEMLIVWLIEHNNLVSKERMFEVYLNVIEWGRNVYGIAEASRHYFLKSPSELNLGESIFLASIVPSPKNGLYRFDEYGGLKPYLRGYFRLIGTLMANEGMIARDSTRSYGYYNVSLRNAVLPRPAAPDTTDTDMDRFNLEREIEDAERLLKDLFGDQNATP